MIQCQWRQLLVERSKSTIFGTLPVSPHHMLGCKVVLEEKKRE